jgi:predicted dehydrogenase/threonine dehydrogenase-like Zn-dependent dehydrogenase
VKQILQNARTGALELAEVPAPWPDRGQLLVRTCFSVVSPGTDKLVMEFARKSLLGKARSRPDLVRQVTRKLRQEGPLPTWRAVQGRLEAPQPLGYSSAGVVETVGEGVEGFAPGDRVACAGAGYANHAELAVIPENLAARVPDPVPLEAAAFATLGAIALQGLRVAAPTLGEVAAVVGLGLIGQLAVQCLRANGCRVLGIDLDPGRVKQALDLGADWGARPADDFEAWRARATSGHGADLALVAASAASADPIRLAAELCRLKGRIALVGAMPMDLDRRIFYEKELELRMSTSYGPGRYDRSYEEAGLDYPLAYVRWTENRNLQAFLGLLDSGAVRTDRLDAEIVPFEDAARLYEDLARGDRKSLACVFRYPEAPSRARTLPLTSPVAPPGAAARTPKADVGVAFLGAGNYARGVLLPAVTRRREVRPVALITATGPSARRTGERFGFAACGTDAESALGDAAVDLVFVATRHDSHADLAVRALRAGKAVWLEKPVGLTPAEVDAVAATVRECQGFLSIGYNRRFSSHARTVREAFAGRTSPLAIRYRIAAGPPPRGSWIDDPRAGGGRIVGEVCHFVDLCTFLVGAAPETVQSRSPGVDPERDDSLVAVLGFPDRSTAVIEYLADASPRLPKEHFEVSGGGCTAICRNFRTTRVLAGGGRTRRHRTLNQDKGQAAAVAEVLEAVRAGRPSPFRLEEITAVSKATFAILEFLHTGLEAGIEP